MDFLNMSDEDLLNTPESAAVAPVKDAVDESQSAADVPVDADAPAADASDDATDTGDATGTESADADEALAAADDAAAEGEAAAADTGKADQGTEVPESDAKDVTDAPDAKDTKDAKDDKPADAAIDYKAEYDKLMAPFKANGKEFKVKSVEEVQSLMQMGANYSKKMAQLKPNLKLMKTLENAGLLSEDKISYLIDLMANKPGAVNKLVKDQGIDPMELDAEKAGEYQAGNHTVGDTEFELDEVMQDLRESPKVQELITLVTTELDHASKKAIKEQPAILTVIDNHMNSGVYDVIMTEMNRERTLGRLKNLSMLDAYKQIGDAIDARGGFAHLFPGSSQTQTAPPAAPREVTPPKSSKPADDKLTEKRRAASSNRPVVATPSTKTDKDFDPLNMSDADFAKLGL